MRKYLFYSVALMILLQSGVFAKENKPVISVSAMASTPTGGERVFLGPVGRTTWSPSLPLYKGDRLTLTFAVKGKQQPYQITVSLDGRHYGTLKKPPWSIIIHTAGLKAGRHLAKGDVRLNGGSRMYGIAEFVFYVQEPPDAVKGMVQTLGNALDSVDSSAAPAETPRSFIPPKQAGIDLSFIVTLRSLDTNADIAIKESRPVHISKPTAFYIQDRRGLDRWSYMITRDGRQIAGAGPMRKLIYLEVAPKSESKPGLLPGNVLLSVWGVKSNGIYSEPVEIPIVIE
ncbi:MAG: hypothetical protein Q7N50_14010 [Armatimonadota bacterium]|nr:hypothetical protein [Armatimonadota bacterium]